MRKVILLVLTIIVIVFADAWVDFDNDEPAGITVIASNNSHSVIKSQSKEVC